MSHGAVICTAGHEQLWQMMQYCGDFKERPHSEVPHSHSLTPMSCDTLSVVRIIVFSIKTEKKNMNQSICTLEHFFFAIFSIKMSVFQCHCM